jgi:hypothetical protein
MIRRMHNPNKFSNSNLIATMNPQEYIDIIVESYEPENTSGLHGKVHIRPCPGQDPFLPEMHVECSKALSRNYPVGTKFRIRAKLKSRLGGNLFVYSNYNWKFDVL